jgi:DNA helicase II / ATP-dependent DNA helicase PcrA
MAWDDELVGVARFIAATDETPLRVMAGPGTGKTFAMKRRVARLLEEGANARRILVVTFTRTAAADLVWELGCLDVEGCGDIRAGTLHAFCFSLLSRAEVLEHLGRHPRPIITFPTSGVLQFEAAPLLQDLDNPVAFGPNRDRTRRIKAFEAAWARLQHEEPGWPANAVDEQFQESLLDWLRFHRAMLIGELVPEALRYLRGNPACAALEDFDHFIVDEYQDLNRAEQVLLDVLAGDNSFAIVGDQDQSIYSFRHAHPDGIMEFAGTHVPTHDEELVECRRCPRRVVRVADYLIRRNYPPGTAPRLLPLETNAEGEVHLVQWNSMATEGEGLAGFVQHLIADRECQPDDILILTPRRLIAYGIRDALLNLEIPVHSFYHEEALDSDLAQRALCLLTLASNREDRVALRFWLGLGSPSWNAAEYARLRAHCEATGDTPVAALERLHGGHLPIPGTTRLLGRFGDLQLELEALEPLTGAALVDYLFPEDEEDVQLLREAAMLTGAIEDNMNHAQLREVLTTYVTQPEMPEIGAYVRIMSLYKSKGLTSKVVIVAGCNEGLIPTIDHNAPLVEQRRQLKEQRRLFYVAITRPRKILALSSFLRIERRTAYRIGVHTRGRGAMLGTIASQFLAQLGPDAPDPVDGMAWQDHDYGTDK